MRHGRLIVYLLLMAYGWLTIGSALADTLIIGYPEEKNAFHGAAAEILREAYSKLGINVKFRTFPSARSLQLSNDGVIDGELVRIAGIHGQYPNLIRVPISHVQAEQMAFSRNPDTPIHGWISLKKWRLVFHRGYVVAFDNTHGMNVQLVNNDIQAFKMVEYGRADIAIANRFTGLKILQELGVNDIQMLTPPVEVNPLYHYLNKKHENLVPKITTVLQKMRASGRFIKIYRRYKVEPLRETKANE